MAAIPPSIPNLALWLDATDTSRITLSGSNVTAWNDKSGLGNNMTTQNGNPSYLTNTINGQAVMNLTNSSGFISNATYNLTSNLSLAMVIVVRSGIPTWGSFFTHGSRDNDIALERNGSDTALHFQTNNDNATCNMTYTTDSPAIYLGTMTSGTSRFFERISGGSTVTTTATNQYSMNANTQQTIRIGRSDGNEACNSYIGEVIYYQAVLTTTQRELIEGYLAWKWGLQASLPAGHPYLSVAPFIPLSTPLTIPQNTSLLFVNTSSISKTFILPNISTNPGRLLIFKDIYGSFSTSSVLLSTTGLDGFENNGSTMRLATNYGAWTFINDAVTRWYLVDSYKNTMLVSTITPLASGGGGDFLYFSNIIFKLTTFPTGTVFSDSGGTTLATSSGTVSLWKDSNNAYNFSLGIAPTYSTAGGINAIYFSGNSFLAASSLALNNLNSYTLETVVYLTSVSNTSYFIAKQYNGINSYNRFRSESGTIRWNTHNGSSVISSATAISANQWYHIVVTYDGTTGSIYINGSLSTSTGASLPILDDIYSTNGNTLGAWTGDGNTYGPNMYMAEFNAYSVCLTSNNVNASYTSRRSKYGF